MLLKNLFLACGFCTLTLVACESGGGKDTDGQPQSQDRSGAPSVTGNLAGADEPREEPEEPTPPPPRPATIGGAEATAALEELNSPAKPGERVFFDPAALSLDLQRGESIGPDDPREIWRFSLTQDAVQAGIENVDSVDLSRGYLVIHRQDPFCDPRTECKMVTLRIDGGAGLSGLATRFRPQPDGTLFAIFDASVDFYQGDEVFGSVHYVTAAASAP